VGLESLFCPIANPPSSSDGHAYDPPVPPESVAWSEIGWPTVVEPGCAVVDTVTPATVAEADCARPKVAKPPTIAPITIAESAALRAFEASQVVPSRTIMTPPKVTNPRRGNRPSSALMVTRTLHKVNHSFH
jgi:hypothetical protein